jgi:hypothetical protein
MSSPRASPYHGDSCSPPRVTNFLELRQHEVRRIYLLRTPLNKPNASLLLLHCARVRGKGKPQ